MPVVAETYDGRLNDINGFHVNPEHVLSALDDAKPGVVPVEGNVGGGTGMVCHGFKGGIGTASRKLDARDGGYTVGVLVQCNCCARRELRVAGVPVGQEIPDLLPCMATTDASIRAAGPRCDAAPATRTSQGNEDDGQGSIIVVVATDAPLLPHQLKRVATRVSLGIGRMGGKGENSSGDIFVAFSTANAHAASDTGVAHLTMIPNGRINPLFYATAQATEEAMVNAMTAPGVIASARSFDPTVQSYVRVLDAPSLRPAATQITLSAWAMRRTNQAKWAAIMARASGTTAQNDFWLGFYNGMYFATLTTTTGVPTNLFGQNCGLRKCEPRLTALRKLCWSFPEIMMLTGKL